MDDIRQVAMQYFGQGAAHWSKHLEELGVKLDARGWHYPEYFAFLIQEYHESARYKNIQGSEKALAKFESYRNELARLAELTAYLDAETFEARVRAGMEPGAVLRDRHMELSPLFRYVMALTLGLYDIAPLFQDEAERQLRENTELFRTFSKFKHILPARRPGEETR